jgi:hypothetical protein
MTMTTQQELRSQDADYQKVCAEFGGNEQGKIPLKPIGFSSANQYCCAVLRLHDEQEVSAGANNYSRLLIKIQQVKPLLTKVKNRKRKVSRNNFEERLHQELLPYINSQKVGVIEANLWQNKNNRDSSPHNAVASVRNRYYLLLTKSAILRGGISFQCNLAPLLSNSREQVFLPFPTGYQRNRQSHATYGKDL